MATVKRSSTWMTVLPDDEPRRTLGETEPMLPAEWVHALAQLERTEPLENAEWNHLDEGDLGAFSTQLDDGRPASWPPT